MIFVGILLGLIGLTLMIIPSGSRTLGMIFSMVGGFIIGSVLGQMLINS